MALIASATPTTAAPPAMENIPTKAIGRHLIDQSLFRVIPETPSIPAPFVPRGAVTLYSRITLAGNITGNFGTGGIPDGSGSQFDIWFDDVPVPVSRLDVSGAVTQMISVCEVRVGIYTFAGAGATDVRLYWASLTSTATAPDTSLDSPPNLIGAFTIPASTVSSTKIVTLGDGVNPIAGMEAIPLNMEFLQAGGPVTLGTFAIGAQILSTDDANIGGWRFTTGPDASGNFFWIYDTDQADPETGPWSFGPTPVAGFYVSVKGTPIAPFDPVACCVPGATAVCFVADGEENCGKSDGTPLTGQTTCPANACVPIVCCNLTTGVCSTALGTSTCPGSLELQTGQTTCSGFTCAMQPSPPANDECVATGFSIAPPSNPGAGLPDTLSSQTLVGATTTAGFAAGVPNCTFADTDVWFLAETVSNPGVQYKVTVTPEPSSGDYTLQPLSVSVYDGQCTAFAGGEIACADFSNPSFVYFTNTGSTFYTIRVAFFDPATTRFSVSISDVTIVACCSPVNGLCILSPDSCTDATYNTPSGGATCSPNPCPRGACCAAGGGCSLTGPSGCTGTFQTVGSTCTPGNPCQGSCCNSTTFACTLTDANGCMGAGLTYNGGGTTCVTAPCPAPPRDLCSNTEPALALGVAAPGIISSATGAEISSCSGTNVDVWFAFTPAASGNYRVTTTPATANDAGTAIAVFDPPCDPLANTDIACAPVAALGQPSELLVSLQAGTTYSIRVGAFAGDNGNFSILVETISGAGVGACCTFEAECLVVDNAPTGCPSPAVYNGDGSTCIAAGNPCPPGACCFPNSGNCVVTLESFCNAHQNSASPGSWNGADTTCGAPTCLFTSVGNDECTTAFVIPATPFASDVGTEVANAETTTPATIGACNAAAATIAQNSIWYTFTAPSSGILNVQVNNWTDYDMFMSVYTGACGALTEIGCFDDPEPYNINITIANGTQIFLMIAQWGETAGGGWTSVNTTFTATGSCCVGIACTTGQTSAACSTAGGTWNNANSTCTPNPCNQVGVCCQTDGSCTIATPGNPSATCATGTLVVDGTCDPNDCPPPAGGVCCRGASCSTAYTTAAACAAAYATTTTAVTKFDSGASACNTPVSTPGMLGNTTSPCCYANYNHNTTLEVQDIFDFLNDWFAGNKAAIVGGDGDSGTLQVQNIFDFLNAWFAGGCT